MHGYFSTQLYLTTAPTVLCSECWSLANDLKQLFSEKRKVPNHQAHGKKHPLDFGSVILRRLLDAQELKHGTMRHVVDMTRFTN